MAVAHFTTAAGEMVGPKDFPPPKRADLRAWYKAAYKVLKTPHLPLWEERFRAFAKIDWETITMEIPDYGYLQLARKKNLR